MSIYKQIVVLTALGTALAGAAFPQGPAEVVATLSERPGNPAVSADGRLFTSIHPLVAPRIKYVEVLKDGSTVPFPNEEWSVDTPERKARIAGGIAIRIGEDGIAWMLDMGDGERSPKFVGWDLSANRLHRVITLPKEVVGAHPSLQDFALDQKRNLAIIADTGQAGMTVEPAPAFIVVSLTTGYARRVLERHPSLLVEGPLPSLAGGKRVAVSGNDGKPVEVGVALNPITIDPDYEWVYFGAMTGKTVYRMRAAILTDISKSETELAAAAKRYGPKPMSDGISVDSAGNVYITDLERSAIGVTTPGRYRVLASLPEGASWPDGFAFGPDGWLYATVNQLDRTPALNAGKEEGKPPFHIVRVRGLAESRVGR